MKQFNDDHYRKLKERTNLDQFPSWGYSVVRKPEDLPNYKFYSSVDTYNSKVQEVPLHKVVGTTHPSYYGLTWNEMLIYLKRNFVPNLDAAYKDFDNPGPEQVSYDKYNDEYFISGGGNHRSCIAKFGHRSTVKALVTEYVFDQQLFDSTKYILQYFVLSEHFPQTYESIKLCLSLSDRKSHIEFSNYFRSLNPFESKKISDLISDFLFESKNTNKLFAKWPESGNSSDMSNFRKFKNELVALKKKSFER